MGLILRLSLRNLFRQKRRNLLLGIGIAFGMMILVIANSFSYGMVDVLINEVVSNAFGHLVVQSQVGNSQIPIIRDKAEYVKVVKDNIPSQDLIRIDESLGTFGRAVGNRETDNVVLVGVTPKENEDRSKYFNDFFTLVDGDFNNFFSQSIQFPVIISQTKAKSLNVKVNDIIRIRVPMVTGQIETAKLTVVAIANANNSFMDIVLFMEGKRVKQLMGYKPWESASLQMTLRDPKANAKKYADILHQKLNPGLIVIDGSVGNAPSQLLTFKNDAKTKKFLESKIELVEGERQKALGKEGVLISQTLAEKLRAKVGDEFAFGYPTKFRGAYEETFKVKGIYRPLVPMDERTILVNAERAFNFYGRYLPAEDHRGRIRLDHPLYGVLATEWKVLPRSKDLDELQKKYREERRTKTTQLKVDAITMYEGASGILNFEWVLNIVTLIVVMVLFFIILIGVVNTLRMTVRERTREIGTVRAIGMQNYDVRNMFIYETLLLTIFSCITGIVMGIVVMWGLGQITFDTHSALSMILKNKHLNFKMNFLSIFLFFLLIMGISGVTAYFPARRAAKMSAVEALRHYE